MAAANPAEQAKLFLRENESVLERLTEFMLEHNKHTNITRITAPDEIAEKHYADSVLPLILCSVPRGTSVLDVGSGAGFPGIPMKLFRSDLQMVLLDSARKRTDYMNELLRATGIDCEVVNGRSEELAHDLSFRGGYGLVTARALANLSALCEYCLPFVEVGGVFLAMKGHQVNDELASASNAIRVLGGEVERVHEYTLPGGDGRSLVVIRKMSQTPVKYPRRRINITKNPIV